MQTGHGDPAACGLAFPLDAASGEVNRQRGAVAGTQLRHRVPINPTLTTWICRARLTIGMPQCSVLAYGEDGTTRRRSRDLQPAAEAMSAARAASSDGAPCREEDPMFDFRDLFQWERFITPSIIKLFYWLTVGISVLFGLSGIVSGLTLMALSPLAGLFWIIASLIGVVIGVIFARIVAEFVLIMFRINEHLGAIRQRGQQM
jgi:Domain of unknown function (DUF4282)